MKNKPTNTDRHDLIRDIRDIISQARALTRRSVNSLQVISNFLIGMRIVKEEQLREARADYGKSTLKQLSLELTKEFARGYSRSNLEYMRKFYLTYVQGLEGKSQTLSGISEKSQTLSERLNLSQITQTMATQMPLSWSHYLFLMAIENKDERRFYEVECANENWSLRELKRQFSSSFFERLALNKDKDIVKKPSEQGHLIENHSDVIKDPLVLEFLGYEEHHRYSETDLETAIIDKLEHQDLGQMQMYVNYFDRYVKLKDEQATIGIILCKKKKDSLVEITLPKGTNIHATKYQNYLPDKESLKKKLEEAQAEWEITNENFPVAQKKGTLRE